MTTSEVAALRQDYYELTVRVALLEQAVQQTGNDVKRIADSLGAVAKVTGVAFFGGLISTFVAWIVKGGMVN